jgi:hypothetical protein
MIFHVIFGLSLATAGLHLFLTRQRGKSRERVVEVVLLHLLCVQWGFGAALTSIPHILTPDTIAELIGWAPGSPFQVELGFASLGTSILGILSIWLRGWFWLAPIVSRSIFLLGAAGVHIHDIMENGNFSPGSAGPVLFYDIAVPLLSAALFVVYARTELTTRTA